MLLVVFRNCEMDRKDGAVGITKQRYINTTWARQSGKSALVLAANCNDCQDYTLCEKQAP